ncbi:MAG: hypothetical protein IPI67_14950 [Myxococcales bacterium]|nr:hypothetical protein [Myxococcales bacterium]
MSAAIRNPAARGLSPGPFLWSPTADLGLFGGSALLAFGVVALARSLGVAPGPLPEWGWLVFVVAVDVAHVWSTLFRTYLDRDELRRHRARYSLIPLGAWAAGVALYAQGPQLFWRVLAYMALFHFIRQQAGWVAVYRARAAQRSAVDRYIDDAAVYAATLYPTLVWHSRVATTDFAWFVKGDFIDLGATAASVLPAARWLWMGLLVVFCLRQLLLAWTTGVFHLGKTVVVLSTAAVWWFGIVHTNSDFEFTVTNVIVHGVPYFALLYAYARARRAEKPELLGSQIVAGGVGAFLGLLLLLGFIEELAWDKLIWHERAWLFDTGGLTLGSVGAALIVPLLALPQATHYVLDGLLWRRGDTRSRPAQRRALGFPG